MGNKQAALIAEVKSAMDDQGVTMTELARVSGSSLSGMSNALAGRSQMREERWRICCEHLGLDYDEIVNNYPGRGTAKKTTTQATEEETKMPENNENEIEMLKHEVARMHEDCKVLAAYATMHLVEDVKAGMDIRLQDLRILLNAVGMYVEA